MPPQAPSGGTLTIRDYIGQEADKLDIPRDLAFAITQTESGGRQGAISPKGATGFFQLMPETAKELGVDASDPFQNISGGLKYFKQQLDAHNQDVRLALAAYNAGPERTKGGTVPDIPETRDYVQRVLAAWQSGGSLAPPPKQATSPPAAASAGMLAPDTATTPAPVQAATPGAVGRFGASLGKAAIIAPLEGIGTLAKTAIQEGPTAAVKQLGKGIIEPTLTHAAKATEARKAGDPVTWAKEIVQAIPVYGEIAGQVGSQAMSGDIAGAAGTALGSIIPLKGLKAIPGHGALGEAAEASAARSMAKLLKAAGDGSPAAEKAAMSVVPMAIDKSLLRVTKGRFLKAVQKAKEATGAEIGRVIDTEVGNTIVPTAPVAEALASLRDRVTNVVPIDEKGNRIGVEAAKAKGITDFTSQGFNDRLAQQATEMERIIQGHGPTVYLRQLVNLRRDWDDFVYASKSWLNKDDMIKQYESRAKSAATDAIRGLISDDPRLVNLANLDKTYHLQSELYGLIADEAFGRGHGLPYFPGFGLKNALTRRMFESAVKAPTWRLMSVATKKRLAESLASNNDSAIRAILRPILIGGAMTVGKEKSPDDLVTHNKDDDLASGRP